MQPFYNCVFTPDGRFLAVGSEEKCTLVLDAANGYTVAHLLGGFSFWVRPSAWRHVCARITQTT